MRWERHCPVCGRLAHFAYARMCRACDRSYDRYPHMTDAETERWAKRRRQLTEARRSSRKVGPTDAASRCVVART